MLDSPLDKAIKVSCDYLVIFSNYHPRQSDRGVHALTDPVGLGEGSPKPETTRKREE
jgi:hypothetical protein